MSRCIQAVHTAARLGDGLRIVMTCQCGYSFAKNARTKRRQFKSYAVIRDHDYPAFLKSEVAVLGARGETAKLEAIGRSSLYVGCLMECPACARLVLVKPGRGAGAGEKSFYQPEAMRPNGAKS